MGKVGLDVTDVGCYADATKWEELLADPDVVVVDTRNDYEVALGTFKGAVNPDTDNFQEFPRWADTCLDPKKNKKVLLNALVDHKKYK